MRSAQRQPLVHGEPFELVEDREVSRIDRVAPVRPPERHHVDRRRLLLERMDLGRGRLGPQHRVVVQEEGIPRRPCGMRRRERELVEVVRDRLDLAVVAHFVTEAEEGVLDQPARLRDRMELAERECLAGQRDVDDVVPERPVELLARDPVRRDLLRCFELRTDVIERPSGLAVADLAQRLRERGAAAEVADVDFGELLGR